MTAPYCPDAGDFIRLNFTPQAGNEQAGMRPALVLSPALYNRMSRLCVVCPVTTQVKGYPFEVVIPGGTGVTGVVLADQVRSLSWTDRASSFIGKCPEAVMKDVRAKVRALLGS